MKKNSGTKVKSLSKAEARFLRRGFELLAVVLFCSVGLVNSCSSHKTNPLTPWQSILDSFSAIQQDLPPIFDVLSIQKSDPSKEIRFNPIRYFWVLDHLKLEPGYTLDYVYLKDGIAGFPILYTRRLKDLPYRNLKEYVQEKGDISPDEYWARIYGRSAPEINESLYSYLKRVIIDDTPIGYFQFVVLRLMGSQFYLFWHAGYNDKTIICDYAGLEALLAGHAQEGPESFSLPSSLMDKATRLNFEPSIVFSQQSVTVKVVVFTKWGGFIQEAFQISRRPPQRILKESHTVLLAYDCGISY